MSYHPFFISLLAIIIILGVVNVLFLTDKGIIVYEKGILIPISRFRNIAYTRQNIKYKQFVPFADIKFFYPCSFKIYNNIIIPNGLTIQTSYFEYHLPHEFARVLSKKLKVALKDEFDRLYKADYCIYRTAQDWDVVDDQFAKYSSMISQAFGVFIGIFLVLFFTVVSVSYISGYSFTSIDPILQALIILDSAIISAYLLRKIQPGLFRKFYHAVFRTWLAQQKGEKIPEKVSVSYRTKIKGKIAREADVLEVFDLDRKERFTHGFFLNLVLLIQVMLIFSIIPPEVFFGHEADHSGSDRFFDYKPLVIEKDMDYKDTEIFANEIVTGDHSVTMKNVTIWALGGPLLNVGPGGSITAEDTRISTPDLSETFTSIGSRSTKHFIQRDVIVPQGSRLEFLTEYSMDYGFDFGYVEISSDGLNWTPLASDSTTKHRNEDAEVGYEHSPAFTGTRQWSHETISLEGYSGSVTIRFYHVTDKVRTLDTTFWRLSNIRLSWEGGMQELPRQGWDIFGWYVGEVTPEQYWITLEGDGEFRNCRIESPLNFNPSLNVLGVLNLDSTNVRFTDCTIDMMAAPSIFSYDSTIHFQRVNYSSEHGVHAQSSNLTIVDSTLNSYYSPNLWNSFYILENTIFTMRNDPMDVSDIDLHGTSGVMVNTDVEVTIHAVLPNGDSASGVAVTIEAMNGDTEVSGTTNQSGFFWSPLFSGYEYYGTSAPRRLFDEHVIVNADMYRIIVGSRTYYRYIGTTSSFILVTGEAPDLTPNLSSFTMDYNEETTYTTLGMEIMNVGNQDAEGFSVFWRFGDDNVTQENLTIPAGGSLSLNATGNSTWFQTVKIDSNFSVTEFDEENNFAQYSFDPSNPSSSQVYVNGNYVTESIIPKESLAIMGNLVVKGGTLDFTSPQGQDRILIVAGYLYIDNCTDLTSESTSFSISSNKQSFITNSDLPYTSVHSGVSCYLKKASIDYLKPTKFSTVLITDSTIDQMDVNSRTNFMIVRDSNIGTITVDSLNMLMVNNIFTSDHYQDAIILKAGHYYLEDNEIHGYRQGIVYQGQILIMNDNVFKDCDLAVKVDFDDSLDLINDVLDHNTIDNCDRKIEYYHSIEIFINAPSGQNLATILSNLKYLGKLESDEFSVMIESDTGIVYEDHEHRGLSIQPTLMQFSILGDGSYVYTEFKLSVYKQYYGYHYSTFSDIDEALYVVVEMKGDAILQNMVMGFTDDGIQLGISATAMGTNVTDLDVGIFKDGERTGTVTFPLVPAGIVSYQYFTLSLESGITNVSLEIVSSDTYPGNNEIWKLINMITTDQTISLDTSGTTNTTDTTDTSLLVGSGATLEVRDGTLDFHQVRDNQHEIVILPGGKLILDSVVLQSDRPYLIRNYGDVDIINSEIIRPLSDLTVHLEDAQFLGNSIEVQENGLDPYELRLNSGLINYGTLTMEGSRLKEGGIYSNGTLLITDSTLTGGYYPSDHPEYLVYPLAPYNYPGIFSWGSVEITNSNISHYMKPVFFYDSTFSISDSEVKYSSAILKNLTEGKNWASYYGGMFILRSNGSITNSAFNGTSLDVRNSTVDIKQNVFRIDDPVFNKRFSLIFRNSQGSFSDNEVLYTVEEYGVHTLFSIFILKNCTGMTIRDNVFTGIEGIIGIENYYTSPEIHSNIFRNLSYGIVSFETITDHTTNQFFDIYQKEYSQRYRLIFDVEDGSGHTVEDFVARMILPDGKRMSILIYPDSLYHNDYLVDKRINGDPSRVLTWLEGYYYINGSRTDNDPYIFNISKRLGNEYEVNHTYLMNENIGSTAVLPMPELGANLRIIPADLREDDYREILFTVYNNGSRETLSSVNVNILITTPEGEQLARWDRHITSIPANSSHDVSISWGVEEREFRILVDVSYYGVEATDSNNSYVVTLIAKKAKEEKTQDTTFRGLALTLLILSMVVLGSVYIKRLSQERTDAMGINFDVDEFRRSLKAVGTTADASAVSDDDEADAWDTDAAAGSDLLEEDLTPFPETEGPDTDAIWDSEEPEDIITPAPPTAVILVPGKDICPECYSKLEEPGPDGIVSCSSCSWMKFDKGNR